MKLTAIDPPRIFSVGRNGSIRIKDCGRLELGPDEQITFVTASGGEYDVVRKPWGYYATPSLDRRLPSFGLRPALIRSEGGRHYLLLVERDRMEEFSAYMASQNQSVVAWLDDQETLARIHGLATRRGPGKAEPPACLCGERDFDTVFDLFNPPPGETRFPIVAGTYHRSIHRCRRCGHFLSTHDMTVLDAYSGEYVDATYGDLDGIRRDFDRISSLPPERSDNAGRVRRILDFTDARIPAAPDHPRTVLDVGSGLCIFLHGMKQAGWEGTALDPDPRAVKHARMVVGVRAVQGDFLAMSDLGHFHLVTFNKVLEHVHDPVAMLARSAGLLEPNGMIYLELPDGELALENPGVREEFFIEHHHIFSAASMALLIAQAGFELLTLERLQEPSGKLTLRAFVVPRAHQREAS